jgi:hypothetical protein
MRSAVLCVLVGAACVVPAEEPELASTSATVWDGGGYDDEGEVIVIEGDFDACLDHHVCWGDLDEDPKDCSVIEDPEACYDCCQYNADEHYGWVCRRLPNKTKKDKAERAKCWEEVEKYRAACQKDCPRIIISRGVR